ncbi:hypothetical protein ONZ45_g14289 [Pleurotus djamor]|nr:hypothetical protein ONZ45_g14289 [Pleurotus djamor]
MTTFICNHGSPFAFTQHRKTPFIPNTFSPHTLFILQMSTRLFALIVGIDSYQSGSVWNLESCVQDAKNMYRWLTHDLCVPKDQICLLLDRKATKAAVEDNFVSHLINNPAIRRGDAILFYFAGHGSSMAAPKNWMEGDIRVVDSAPVEVLCTYDYQTKVPTGSRRIPGISDRSMNALLSSLYEAKGDNITVILDCCFTPRQTKEMIRHRRHLRWTPTKKLDSNDLIDGLWPGARGRKFNRSNCFYQTGSPSHVLIAACRSGEGAAEGKDGGRLTSALLEVFTTFPVHRLTNTQLVTQLAAMVYNNQVPLCAGRNRDRLLFNGVPFIADARYIPVRQETLDGKDEKLLRIEAGSVHGIIPGSEFSLHLHNVRGSPNAALTNVKVVSVHPTASYCSVPTSSFIPRHAWARMLKWNNRPSFRVHLQKTCSAFLRSWKLWRKIPSTSKPGASSSSTMIITHHDAPLLRNQPVVKLGRATNVLGLLDNAARFHLHLQRHNPDNPFRNLVTMELFKLDPGSHKRIGSNLLIGDDVNIEYEKNALYSVVVHNKSDVPLWPSLAYLDPNCYGITMLYHPDPQGPVPLPISGCLELGTGKFGSKALSFNLGPEKDMKSGFLKLFVTSLPTPMGILEQGPSPSLLGSAIAEMDSSYWKLGRPRMPNADLWDAFRVSVNVKRMA